MFIKKHQWEDLNFIIYYYIFFRWSVCNNKKYINNRVHKITSNIWSLKKGWLGLLCAFHLSVGCFSPKIVFALSVPYQGQASGSWKMAPNFLQFCKMQNFIISQCHKIVIQIFLEGNFIWRNSFQELRNGWWMNLQNVVRLCFFTPHKLVDKSVCTHFSCNI